MADLTLLAPAKINLYLEILGNRGDGFHELAMVMQSVGLADRLRFRPTADGSFSLSCDHPEVPVDDTNLVLRAARLMAEEYPEAHARHGGVAIALEKRIPVGAGLAGGSADGSAVIVALDHLWSLNLSRERQCELAARLGSDMPFSLVGGTMLATGRGEILQPLPSLAGQAVVLAKYRSLAVSTVWAYQTYRERFGADYRPEADFPTRHEQIRTSALLTAIARGEQGAEIAPHLSNDLEKVVLPEHPAVQWLRDSFARQSGVLGTMMSGSGPTVFALCDSPSAAEAVAAAVAAELADPDLDLWPTVCLDHGIAPLDYA